MVAVSMENRHLDSIDERVEGHEHRAQRGGGQGAGLVIDLRPEQHQQRVGAEEQQARQVQQHLLHDGRVHGLDLGQTGARLLSTGKMVVLNA